MCGATVCSFFSSALLIGLSPRVWGNRGQLGKSGGIFRPIPTCVGQPKSYKDEWAHQGAYPHVCGATLKPNAKIIDADGLSPRVWGNLRFAFC